MTETVHQGKLTREAAAAEGLSQRLLRESAQQILILIREALVRDGQVRIHNFGTFRLRWVKAHRGTNPQTGERIAVPAHPRALFTPAKALREAVEAGRLSAVENTQAMEPEPEFPAVAAARLRTPTLVKRAPADLPGEDAARVPESAADPPSEETPEADSRRPLLALVVVAVVVLAVLLVFWPQGDQGDRVAPAPERSAAQSTPSPAPAAAPESTKGEEDLSITYTQAGSAMEQVVSASTEPTPAPQTGGSQDAITEATGWMVEALDRPIRRPEETAIARAAPAPAPEISGTSAPASGKTARPIGPGPFFDGRDYRVASGDNLWDLSGEYYVRPYYWPHIYNVNQDRIRNPNLIRSGATIRLPTLYGPPDDLTGEDRHSIAQGYFLLYRLFKRSSDPDAVFALSAVSHFDKSVLAEHEAEIQASHTLEVELAETYGMRIGERIFLAGRNIRFPSRLFD